MADIDTQIDLDELHQAIVDRIAEKFDGIFLTVRDHEELRDKVATPACMIELSELDPYDDPGTEQIAFTAKYEARIIVKFKEVRAKRMVRKLAADLALFIKLRRWTRQDNTTIPTSPAEIVGCFPDDFSPELDEYEVWRVEWTHVVHIGPTVWAPGDPAPDEVFTSMNGDPYEEITP